MKKYDVAAYVWPSYTEDEIRTRIFWLDAKVMGMQIDETEKHGVNVFMPPITMQC